MKPALSGDIVLRFLSGEVRRVAREYLRKG
jgi:hypothetical protein